jgi:hypothetical protein
VQPGIENIVNDPGLLEQILSLACGIYLTVLEQDLPVSEGTPFGYFAENGSLSERIPDRAPRAVRVMSMNARSAAGTRWWLE